MSLSTFLRIGYICRAPFSLLLWVIVTMAAGFICGVRNWYAHLQRSLKDPVAYHKEQLAIDAEKNVAARSRFDRP